MKKLSKIKTIFLSSFMVIASMVLGLFAGSEINSKYFTLDKYSGLTVEELSDDFSKINYVGKTPDQLTAVETYLVAIHVLENQHTYSKEIFGDMQTNVGINQKLHTINKKIGEDYDFSFVSSSSMYTTAEKTLFKKGSDIIAYQGKASGTTLDTVEWSDKQKIYSYEEYGELVGREPTHENSYIISSKTILSQSDCSISNNLYTYKIVLDPTLSTFKYVNEISYRAGIDKKTITVHSVEMEFTVDSNFQLISEHHQENYSFKFGAIPVTLFADYTFSITY